MSHGAPLVVDTSVALKWFFEEPYSGEALEVLEAFRTGRRRPLAPDLIYPEFANGVWRRVVRGPLEPEDGAHVIAAFVALPLEAVPAAPLLGTAYRLAVELGRTAYDALFLALSLHAGADYVTADVSLHRAAARHLPRVRWLGHWRG